MRKSKKLLLIMATTFSFSLFAPTNKAEAKSILINYDLTEGVNVREDENTDDESNIIGGIDFPDVYEIEDEGKDYFKINYDGKKAYVGKFWFHILDDTKALKDLKIYEKADKKSKKLAKIKKNDKIEIIDFDENEDFIKVKKGDKFGFVEISKTYLSKKDDNNLEKLRKKYKQIYMSVDSYIKYLEKNYISLYEDDDKISKNSVIKDKDYKLFPKDFDDDISSDTNSDSQSYDYEYIYYSENNGDIGTLAYNFSTKFLGNPYVFGGTSLTNGIDCSGFTQQVYGEFGISLPHLAQAQASYGKTINLGEEEAGDLVFFGTSMSDISHVAIADGQGGIIHAANERVGIITSSIGNPIIIKRIVESKQ